MSIEDQIRAVLSDPLNLPMEFLEAQRQHLALNPISTARTSGDRIASGQRASVVTTVGTTFAAGADVLASPLTFTADGKTDYLIKVVARDCTNNTATARCIFRLNLDGSDQGVIADITVPLANANCPCTFAGVISAPSAGSHTVNVRLVVTSGTGTVDGGPGGASLSTPIFVTLEVA